MPVYWFLLIWTLVVWPWFTYNKRFVNLGGVTEARAWKSQAIIGFAPIIFFAGMKGRGIIDSGGYVMAYKRAATSFNNFNWSSKGFGFDFLEVLFKSSFGLHYQYWIFFIALISCLLIIKPIYKHSPLFGLSLFLFVASTEFTYLLNGVRQFLAVALLFGYMDLIVNKKYWKYLIVIFISFTIHKTALIVLPVLFISQLKLYSRQFGLITLAFLMVSLLIEKIIPMAAYFFQDTVYEKSLQEAANLKGTNIFRLAVAAVPPIMVLIFRKKIVPKITPTISIVLNMTVFNFGIFLVSTSVGGNLFGRLAQYFSIYTFIALPWLIQNCFETKTRNIVVFLTILFYSFWFYFQMVLVWNLPYHSDTLGIHL